MSPHFVGFVVGVLAGILLTLAVLWLLRRQGTPPFPGAGSSAAPHKPAEAGELERLHQNLRVKTLHNDMLIHRLVQAERERAPGASDVECYRAAIERWERDNR